MHKEELYLNIIVNDNFIVLLQPSKVDQLINSTMPEQFRNFFVCLCICLAYLICQNITASNIKIGRKKKSFIVNKDWESQFIVVLEKEGLQKDAQ